MKVVSNMIPATATATATATLPGYMLYGQGPIRVLVMHDWLSCHRSYQTALPWLDDESFTYLFIDLRGYGLSMTLPGEYSLAEITRDCLKLVDALGWQDFHVIGHSMTGMVTQRLAADLPDRINSAITVCPVSAAGNRLSPQAYDFFINTIDDDEALARLFTFVSSGLSHQWARYKVRQHRETVNYHCRRAYLDMFVNVNFVEDVRGLKTPFLVMIGDNDPGLDIQAMSDTFLAWHPNAVLQVMPHCGHYPMQECPPYFAAVIESFIKLHVR